MEGRWRLYTADPCLQARKNLQQHKMDKPSGSAELGCSHVLGSQQGHTKCTQTPVPKWPVPEVQGALCLCSAAHGVELSCRLRCTHAFGTAELEAGPAQPCVQSGAECSDRLAAKVVAHGAVVPCAQVMAVWTAARPAWQTAAASPPPGPGAAPAVPPGGCAGTCSIQPLGGRLERPGHVHHSRLAAHRCSQGAPAARAHGLHLLAAHERGLAAVMRMVGVLFMRGPDHGQGPVDVCVQAPSQQLLAAMGGPAACTWEEQQGGCGSPAPAGTGAGCCRGAALVATTLCRRSGAAHAPDELQTAPGSRSSHRCSRGGPACTVLVPRRAVLSGAAATERVPPLRAVACGGELHWHRLWRTGPTGADA